MAPRRNVKITAQENSIPACPQPLPRTRLKKTQPIQARTVTTISISNNKSTLDVPDAMKKVDPITKIALANEVARSQIVNQPVEVRLDPPPPKKRGRKKLVKNVIVSEFFTPDEIKKEPDVEIKSEITCNIENKIKKITGKLRVKKPPTKSDLPRKRTATSTIQKPKIKRPRLNAKPISDKEEKDLKDKTLDQINVSGTDTPQNNESPTIVNSHEQSCADCKKTTNVTSDVSCNQSSPTKVSATKLRTRAGRGKQACIVTPEPLLQPKSDPSPVPITPSTELPKPETPNIKSPKPKNKKSSHTVTPLDLSKLQALRVRSAKKLSQCAKPTKKEAEASKPKNAVPVEIRQSSISSISNLSWTRDISNSSTTTCITVSSKDFVCIDNKLPIIKLTNIDSEVDKYKPATVLDEDSSSTSDSSSSDSETDSSSSCEQLSDSRHLPSGCTSLVKVKSLNLSYSSLDSLQDQCKDRNLQKQDYERAAEKLMYALKKIDMEFINWIHDAECVTTDLDRIKDNLYTILNNELCALKHCRNLQELFNTDKNDSSKGITSNPKVIAEKHVNYISKTANIQNNTMETNRIEPNQVKPNTVNEDLINDSRVDTIKIISKLGINNSEGNPTVSKLLNSPKRNDVDSSPITKSNESNISNKPSVESEHVGRNIVENKPEEHFLKPTSSAFVLNNGKRRSRRISDSTDSSSGSEDNRENVDNTFIQDGNDDDDALSLFAESITGIESSRYNTSNISAPVEKHFEEYIPKPIQKNLTPPNYYYCPTKISETAKNGIVRNNADSTFKESISLPSEYKQSASQADSIDNSQELVDRHITAETFTPRNLNKPGLIGHLYRLYHKETNVIFRGYCYYNLINRCTYALYGKMCRYSHEIPDDQVVKNKLIGLSNDVLIKEYMLIRRSKQIMRQYGLCLLLECVKRQLTRVVVEIAYDFIMRFQNNMQLDEVTFASIEIVLMHLNNIDLSVCEDLLKLEISNGLQLCEVFMQTMTTTQNFARFKSIFLSLTYFMVNNDRTFTLEVAEHILERVCILPFDEPVIRALIQIMRLTKSDIFVNPMIASFERLIKLHSDIYDEYIMVKSEVNLEKARHVGEPCPVMQAVNQPLLQQTLVHKLDPPLLQQSLQQPLQQPLVHKLDPPLWQQSLQKPPVHKLDPPFLQVSSLDQSQPLLVQTADQPLRSEVREGVPLPPSPDTTNLDNLNKVAEETVVPKITRTIQGFASFPKSQMTGISPNRSNVEEIIHTPNFKNWRHRSIFQKFGTGNFPPPMHVVRPTGRPLRPNNRLMRERQFNQRLVTFGASPIAYPPPEPEF